MRLDRVFSRFTGSKHLKLLDELEKKKKNKLILMLFLQVANNFLDLLAVLLVGISVRIQLDKNYNFLQSIERISEYIILDLRELDRYQLSVATALFAIFLLVVKTLLSILLVRKSLEIFAEFNNSIFFKIFNGLKTLSFSKLLNISSAELNLIISRGVEVVSVHLFAAAYLLVSDLFLLALMFGLVFAIDFVMALALGVGLLSVAGYVILKSHFIAKQKSSEYAECLVKSEEQVLNLVTLYRELFVSKRLDYFDQNLKASRDLMEKNLTQSAMIPHFNKFVMEIGLVVCFVIFGLTGYLIGDSNEFMYKLVIFIAAGSRILPSLLRVQQGFVQISSHLGLSQSTIEILEEIKAEENSGKEGLGIANYVNLDPKENSIEIRDLDFKHGTGGFELKGVNLQIKRASKVAIVGSSGSGKTTLVDLILGIHSASSGEVLIGGYTNRDFQTLFPGKIGYVPQDSVVIDGSFLDNLLVKPEELPRISFFLDKLLSDVDLNEWIKSLPLELNTRIGTNGIELSGGQKQRIAIVRALINDPGILVLDEATSSLDSKTESVVSETIDSLNRSGKTIIMIAHRLRTVEKADQIVFVHNGKVENFYSWVELKAKHPNFSLNHDPI